MLLFVVELNPSRVTLNNSAHIGSSCVRFSLVFINTTHTHTHRETCCLHMHSATLQFNVAECEHADTLWTTDKPKPPPWLTVESPGVTVLDCMLNVRVRACAIDSILPRRSHSRFASKQAGGGGRFIYNTHPCVWVTCELLMKLSPTVS